MKSDSKNSVFKENFKSISNIESEVDFLKKLASKKKLGITFCHNDLLSGNVLYDDKSGKWSFLENF